MKFLVRHTGKLLGEAQPPSSKSHTVRALLIAMLAKGTSRIINALDSEDTRAAMECCRRLGAEITAIKNYTGGLDIKMTSRGIPLEPIETEIYTGNSGITTTFLMPIAGLRADAETPLKLDCGEQMKKRPLGPIIEALNGLGMEVRPIGGNESCPVRIKGRLEGGYAKIDGINSQYLSALLLALPCAPKNSEICVSNLKERPYVDMTLDWLAKQDIRLGHFKKDKTDIYKIIGRQNYHAFEKTIPGDFSSASYIIAAAAILPGEVIIHGMDMDDPQGDKRLVPILQSMGADIKIDGQDLRIHGGNPLKGMIIDCEDIPDLLPTLAVIGTIAEGKTTLLNSENARIKETDRMKSMSEELKKMGAAIEERKSSLVIRQSRLHGTLLHGHSDHRTIMALAVAGLLAEGQTEIDTAEAVGKTFPGFVETMNSLGADIKKL